MVMANPRLSCFHDHHEPHMCLNCCLIGMPELHLKCYDPACLTRADGKSGKINGVEMLRKSHGRVHVGGKGTWVWVWVCVWV
jgi:hypothetical protein